MIRSRLSLRGAALALAGAVAVAIAAVALVWPIWYLATTHTDAYTLVCLAAMGASLAWAILGKGRRRRARTAEAPSAP